MESGRLHAERGGNREGEGGMKGSFAGIVVGFLVAGSVNPADVWKLPSESTVLKPGKGREVVLGQCVVCHSVDYVTTQPPLPRAAWVASIEKMRSKYGAPVPTNSVVVLADYLTEQYGRPDAKP